MNSSQEPSVYRTLVAPSPEEREAISSPIEGNETLIDDLSKEMAKNNVIVQQNESKAAIAAGCLDALNADLARAIQLRNIIAETLKRIELFEVGGNENTPVSQDTREAGHPPPESVIRLSVSGISNEFHIAAVGSLKEIEATIETATSAAHCYRQEVDTANSIISMTRADIRRTTDRINEYSAAITAKKFGSLAICQIPDEIWALIFQHSISTKNVSVALNDDWVRNNTSWHGALVISTVSAMAVHCPFSFKTLGEHYHLQRRLEGPRSQQVRWYIERVTRPKPCCWKALL